MSPRITIKSWNDTFENADTRKRMRLGWFLCPSGVDSSGYIELMSQGEAGLKAYAVFLAICQWSATCLPVVRGSCARSDGRPFSTRQIAAAIRIPEGLVADAIEVLSSPDIGWLVVEELKENKQSAGSLPVACQSPAGSLPQGEGEGKGKGKGIMSVPSNGRPSYSDSFEEFWGVFPKRRRTKKRDAYAKWKLATKDHSPAWLARRAAEYATSPKGQGEYAVMPSTWLNSGMYDDDPDAWGCDEKPASRVPTDEDLANWQPTGVNS